MPNATAGVNAVLRSLRFVAGDELLLTNHTYDACRATAEFLADRCGVQVVTATLPFPCADERAIVEAVISRVSRRTRLALIDHVTSPTALILPVKRLIDELHLCGVDTLVDGAHAPGMIPLSLTALGAAYYTGNAHKWLCAPKGAAFLHARRDRQAHLHPTVISRGYSTGFHAEFDWVGTLDPTPWLCIPGSIRYMGGLLPGGWPEVMAANRALVLRARALILDTLQMPPPCPESMIGSIASVPLPSPLFFGTTMLVQAFLLGSFEKLVHYVIFTDNVTIAVVASTLFVLRRRGSGAGGYCMWGYPVLPALFLVCLLAVSARVFMLEPLLAFAGLGILLTGWPLFLMGRRFFGA